MLLCTFAADAAQQDVWNLPRDSWGYVNQKGKVVIQPQFATAQRFMHGFAQCIGYSKDTGKSDWKTLVFLDRNGRQYKLATDGHGRPTIDNAYEYFDVKGKRIQQDTFSFIRSRRGDLMLLQRSYDYCVVTFRAILSRNYQAIGATNGRIRPRATHGAELVARLMSSRAYQERVKYRALNQYHRRQIFQRDTRASGVFQRVFPPRKLKMDDGSISTAMEPFKSSCHQLVVMLAIFTKD